RIDLGSEQILVRGLQGSANVGGALAIGLDGRLYIGVGDGSCDSGQAVSSWFATCLTNGNGKILRVNLDLDAGIPSDNPLYNATSVRACGSSCGVDPSALSSSAAREDIWAWGLRNPWRIWFDAVTGKLWVGDVGETSYEEIDVVERGKHYGWPFREGAAGEAASRCGDYTPQSGDCLDPVYFCGRQSEAGGIDGGCLSIAAGRIVDSCTWPAPWRGRYFFGDEATRALWALPVNEQRNGIAGARVNVGTLVRGAPVSFQVGPDGALYVAAHAVSGSIVRIAPIAPTACEPSDGGGPGGDAGTGQPDGGGGGAVGGGGHPVPPRPPAASACGCRNVPVTEALIALLVLARARRPRRGA
ncbi:MAG TPA: PQQ-dependent sugar dehydrogenase, partial [Myxococcaceae bacterium]|nr:PQQ-dependent sugar dehydrogenase [Myxococcaceae bacterium]